MSQISHIKYKDIVEAWRFDADFFKPEFINTKNILEKKKNIEFWTIIKSITDWKHWWVTFVDKWILFIRNINIVDWTISINEPLYISEEESLESKRAELKPWNLLLTSIGKVWESAVVPEEIKRANINQNLVKIEIKDDYSPYYISVFLNSVYWKSQTTRYAAWNIQPILNYDNIKSIKIPEFPTEFQNKIEDIAKLSHDKKQHSKQLYQEAEDLLLTELWLKNHTISHTLTFSTTKKAVDEAWRYDADYFQPKYDELIEKIENYKWGWDYVENLFKQNLSVAKTDSETCNYVEIWDINISNWEIIPNEIFVLDLPANWKRVLKKNDLLISKVRPYRWAVSFIDFNCENLIWSWAFTILQEKSDYKKEVLMVFLKTECIKDLLLRYNCGTSYPVIKDDTILKLKLPLINPQLQKEISDKIKESFKLRNESKELLEQAKKMVEDEIEKE